MSDCERWEDKHECDLPFQYTLKEHNEYCRKLKMNNSVYKYCYIYIVDTSTDYTAIYSQVAAKLLVSLDKYMG